MAITPNDTYTIFIGSGCLSYPWYRDVVAPNEPSDGATDWVLGFTEYGDNGPEGPHAITHKDVMRAVRKIGSKDGAELVPAEARKECHALLFQGADAADFDADAADVVLQLAAFGEVVYG